MIRTDGNHTNCCNCGAPLPRSGECEYCNTVNDQPGGFTESYLIMDASGIRCGVISKDVQQQLMNRDWRRVAYV